MARTPTTFDSFNAIAEPKRRQVLEILIDGELPVNDLVGRLGWTQPMVSKHLSVLKEVGLVSMRKHGRQRFYKVDGDQLKPLYDWLTKFEKLWGERFDRLDHYLQELQRKGDKNDE